MDHDKLLDILGNLYQAAIDSKHWPQALEGLRQVLNGGAYAHFIWNKRTGDVPVIHVAGYSPVICDAYMAHYAKIEPGADFLRRNAHLLPFVHDLMWIDEQAMDRDEFHTWLERESGMRYRLGALVAQNQDYFGITAVQRSRQQGPATEPAQQIFLRLLPHLRRATIISQELAALRSERQSLVDALQGAHQGILFLDEHGRVTFANRAALAILSQRDGLLLDRNGCPRAVRSSERSALDRLVASLVTTGFAAHTQVGGAIEITRPSGRRPYAVTIAPFRFPALEAEFKSRSVAAIFVTDLETRHVPPEDVLRRLYGLTHAEAKLAIVLLGADSLKATADILGLTAGSARQTLKRVFSKTECHSQATLVRLLLSLPSQAVPYD